MKDFTLPLQLMTILADGHFHSQERLEKLLETGIIDINEYVSVIREWGIEVLHVNGKGYTLPAPLELLNDVVLRQSLSSDAGQLFVVPIVDSTNQYLLDRVAELRSGDACVAEYQYAGRGRRGRQWISPFGTNLCFSLFWRLEKSSSAVMGLSLAVAVAIAETLKDLGVSDVKVKWPNDLYLYDCKLAGILVESTGKMGDVLQLIIGVGLNLSMQESASNVINQRWISLQQTNIKIDRNQLLVQLLIRLRTILKQFEREGLLPFIQRWASMDNFMNKPVSLLIEQHSIYGICRGIDEHGALLLEQDGRIETFVVGEMSLRGAI